MSLRRLKCPSITLPLRGAGFGLTRIDEPEIRVLVISLSAFFTMTMTAPNIIEITTTAYITPLLACGSTFVAGCEPKHTWHHGIDHSFFVRIETQYRLSSGSCSADCRGCWKVPSLTHRSR